jgi:hypothetical protein
MSAPVPTWRGPISWLQLDGFRHYYQCLWTQDVGGVKQSARATACSGAGTLVKNNELCMKEAINWCMNNSECMGGAQPTQRIKDLVEKNGQQYVDAIIKKSTCSEHSGGRGCGKGENCNREEGHIRITGKDEDENGMSQEGAYACRTARPGGRKQPAKDQRRGALETCKIQSPAPELPPTPVNDPSSPIVRLLVRQTCIQFLSKQLPRYYVKSKSHEKLIETYYCLEDYDSLTKFIPTLPEGSPLLMNIGREG